MVDGAPSDEHLEICLAVLRSLTTPDGVAKPDYKSRRYRALRVALQPFVDDANGNNIADLRLQKQQRRILQAQAQKDFEHDRKAKEKTRLWAERVRMRDELEGGARLEGAPLRIADGAVAEPEMLPLGGPAARLSASTSCEDAAAAAGRAAALEAEAEAEEDAAAASGQPQDGAAPSLVRPAACYICKERFRRLHHFYSKLCPACAELNFRKRSQAAHMTGRVVLVTGARIKIGFHVCLKLLRAGATVIATTRFPVDAARRFAAQPDFAAWRDNLRVYGIDLRDVRSLEQLCSHLLSTLQRLDAIINNACQTIRRPQEYYMPLLQAEEERGAHGPEVSRLLRADEECFYNRRPPSHPRALTTATDIDTAGSSAAAAAEPEPEPEAEPGALSQQPSAPSDADADADGEGEGEGGEEGCEAEAETQAGGGADGRKEKRQISRGNNDTGAVKVTQTEGAAAGADAKEEEEEEKEKGTEGVHEQGASAAAEGRGHAEGGHEGGHVESHTAVVPQEANHTCFPAGATDVEGQQLDLRRVNSWLLKLPEVSTSEAAEVLAINTLAPFTLNSRLHPLLLRSPEAHRFVVNVSAMEGKFNRYKTPNHPHTNMAKAALNMMTRTCAEDLAKTGVYMNSVDTGWINDENPLEKARVIAEKHHFQTPLDEIDAAARILDPIFDVVNGATPMHGQFLKNYASTSW